MKICIAMVQTYIEPSIQKNIENMDSELSKLGPGSVDFIVLNECWNAPYLNDKLLESVNYASQSLSMLQRHAKRLGTTIFAGSIATKENDDIFNRMYIIDPRGNLAGKYDKTHLFEVHTKNHVFKESGIFKQGNQFLIIKTNNIKIGCLLCYDIRFVEPARLLRQQGIDLLVLPASFNKSVTQAHWKPLLQCRAIENGIYIIGINPAKYSYKTFESLGHSMAVDPFGKVVEELGTAQETKIIDIDLDRIQQIRNRMPLFEKRRTDLYEYKGGIIHEIHINQ